MSVGKLAWVLGAGAVLVASGARDARACGGCFHPPMQNGTVVTDHRMIFSVSPQMTTLYDEIEYQGSPSSFAWVLPIHGPVRVGLSADVLFGALDQVTHASIVAPPLPPCACQCFSRGAGGIPAPMAPTLSGGGGGGTVTVISQQVVGPYDTVQLQSTDPNALNAWLVANGYAIPPSVQPIVAAYVSEGFDFLAMRLAPGQGVQAMRPISVTSSGAGLSLPLRMVAAGTGATVGVTLWVVSSGRYEPQNFPKFTISASELIWDWSKNASNYTTVQAQKEAALNDAAWQIESSLDIGPYQVQQIVLYGQASTDYTAIPTTDAGPGQTADQVRAMDLATLFPLGGSSVRITRMRADLSRAALATDLVLQASTDQSAVSNIYQTTQQVNAPQCPSPAMCPCGGGSSGSSGGTNPFGGSGQNPPVVIGGGVSDGGSASSPGAKQEAFGCATSPAESSSGGFELALVGLVGAALVRARARRKR
jgi:MYXO-CTERM domain-containing protein